MRHYIGKICNPICKLDLGSFIASSARGGERKGREGGGRKRRAWMASVRIRAWTRNRFIYSSNCCRIRILSLDRRRSSISSMLENVHHDLSAIIPVTLPLSSSRCPRALCHGSLRGTPRPRVNFFLRSLPRSSLPRKLTTPRAISRRAINFHLGHSPSAAAPDR